MIHRSGAQVRDDMLRVGGFACDPSEDREDFQRPWRLERHISSTMSCGGDRGVGAALLLTGRLCPDPRESQPQAAGTLLSVDRGVQCGLPVGEEDVIFRAEAIYAAYIQWFTVQRGQSSGGAALCVGCVGYLYFNRVARRGVLEGYILVKRRIE